ncbi:hypothetical protein APHAL10511_004265 [Amanita phalloides]|nr:hypothetical protein APHAL10511_004265 [Amanita phalloides]
MSNIMKRASVMMTSNGAQTNSTAGKEGTPESSKTFRDFRDQVKKGNPLSFDISTVSSVVDFIRHKEEIDDRKFLLEHGLTFVSRLNEGPIQNAASEDIIKLLYNDLPHPATTWIGDKYSYRTADGSYNNIDAPEMGKAGTPYSRSVQQAHPLPRNQLPDPGLVFDTLLRREQFVKHPAGLSSLFFSFAALVIHTVFRTSHRDANFNETSSYVDLAPLYGNSQASQYRIRVSDGYGLLYPDSFAEDRLLLLPPAVCVLLVLFSRNHNYIARKIFEINEIGTLKDPKMLTEERKGTQDEYIFQTARLINCGWFGSIVFSDYFSCILGLVRSGNSWSLIPFSEIRNSDHTIFERGRGNVCSAEFNCLYRWHATISVEDEKWTRRVFKQLFGEQDTETITVHDFKQAAAKAQALQPDVTHWTFGGMQRQAGGAFKDDDLANALHNATEHPGGAFRARGTPPIMRLNEIMGIEQNRQWGVCSLNDFRKFIGLKSYNSFLEWNSNVEIASAAEKLYGNIENLELYVGLQAEEAKPVMEGAGLCPGYTISRAILSDAIALTRGDRFFTHDFTPRNLTAWGFADCQRDANAFGFGSTLGRLLLRTLPNNFTENSVYTFFPLMTPDAMKTHLTELRRLSDYDLSRPQSRPHALVVAEYGQIGEILQDKDAFTTEYAARAARVVKGKGFYTVENSTEQEAVVYAMVHSPENPSELSPADQIGGFFYTTTRKLVEENSFTLVGGKECGVDVVRHVAKVVPVCWSAQIAGIKLKLRPDDQGKYTPSELYDMLADIYNFIFLEVDQAKYVLLGEKAVGHIHDLIPLIKNNAHAAGPKRLSIIGKFGSILRMNKKSQSEVVNRINEISRSTDQLTNTLLALMISATAELSLALTNVLNLYLGTSHSVEIAALATKSDAKDDLQGYAREALRIDPPFQGVYRVCKNDKDVLGFQAQANQRIFLDVHAANTNEKAFPNPLTVNVSRTERVAFYADGLNDCLGLPLTVKIVSEVLRAVYSFKNVRRAPGNSGTLQRFKDTDHKQLRYSYLGGDQLPTPWPSSLTIQYDV